MAKSLLGLMGLTVIMMGCNPTVKVEAPDKPIVINMNMKIDHKVRVKVKDGLEKAKKDNPEVFA